MFPYFENHQILKACHQHECCGLVGSPFNPAWQIPFVVLCISPHVVLNKPSDKKGQKLTISVWEVLYASATIITPYKALFFANRGGWGLEAPKAKGFNSEFYHSGVSAP